MPNFFRMVARGQKPVKADCSRFRPTKPVNHSHNGLTVAAKITEMRMKLPATAKTIRSMDMIDLGRVAIGCLTKHSKITKIGLMFYRFLR